MSYMTPHNNGSHINNRNTTTSVPYMKIPPKSNMFALGPIIPWNSNYSIIIDILLLFSKYQNIKILLYKKFEILNFRNMKNSKFWNFDISKYEKIEILNFWNFEIWNIRNFEISKYKKFEILKYLDIYM